MPLLFLKPILCIADAIVVLKWLDICLIPSAKKWIVDRMTVVFNVLDDAETNVREKDCPSEALNGSGGRGRGRGRGENNPGPLALIELWIRP